MDCYGLDICDASDIVSEVTREEILAETGVDIEAEIIIEAELSDNDLDEFEDETNIDDDDCEECEDEEDLELSSAEDVAFDDEPDDDEEDELDEALLDDILYGED